MPFIKKAEIEELLGKWRKRWESDLTEWPGRGEGNIAKEKRCKDGGASR